MGPAQVEQSLGTQTRVRLRKQSLSFALSATRGPLVSVSCRWTWTACTGPETCPAKNFPLRLQRIPRAAKFIAGQVLRFAAPLRVQARRRPSFRSGVDGNKGFPEDSQGNERNRTMANALGYVTETKAGFEGSLAMMNLSASIRIEKNADKAGEGQPDYRIYAGETSTEVGGGWMRKAKQSGREYVSLTLADPQIGPRRIFANLAPVKGKKGRHVILWNPRD
jgi:uncharacterized protein (DUF736 family)